MTKTNTISQRTFLNAILTGTLTLFNGEKELNFPLYDEDGILNEKVRSYAEETLRKLDERNAKRKPSKAQVAASEARAALITEILNVMEAGKPYMASEIAEALTTEDNEVKTARVVAAFKAMEEVKVGETKFKGRTVKTYMVGESK